MGKIIMLDLVELIWKCIGWNMYKTTKLMNIMTLLIIILLMVTMILGLLVPILEEVNTNTLAGAFEIVGPYYQLIIKMIIIKFSINELSILLITMKKSFWPLNACGTDLEKQIHFIDKLVTTFFKLFVYTASTCCTLLCLRPWLMEDSIYPLSIYNIVDKNNRYQYLCMYIWQLANFIFGTLALLAVDGIFIVLVTNIYCQLKMIKYAFCSLKIHNIRSDIEEKKVYDKIKVYVDHHDMILRFIKDVTKLFSLQILNQFVGNTASICMAIYLATEAGAEEFSVALNAFTIISYFLIELALFCTAGTFITEACLDITDAVWVSGWEGAYSKRLRYATQMVIMRSQKRETLRAGKIIDIDLNSFVAILKISVSVYTLMNNVKSKEM